MPATDLQGSSAASTHAHSSSSPFSSFGRTLLSLRRDAAAPASAAASAAASSAMPPPHAGVDPELEEFHAHVAAHLADLSSSGAGGEEEFMSIPWIRRLLDAFLLCQDEFRVALAESRRRRGTLPAAAERLVAEFGERAVKALDVCNAARDGVDQARRWERLAGIAASALLSVPAGAGAEDGQRQIHEGQLRRARKALSDLSVLLIDDAAAAAVAGAGGGLASFLASHRNRSFGRAARASPSRSASSSSSSTSSSSSSPSAHFRSLSWSVSRTWSAARQLQAIGAGLAAPRATEAAAAAGVAAPAYAMGCLLHLAAWALVAAVPCPDRAAALQAHHHHLPSPPPRGAYPWAPPLLALQERLAEEGKRKDRRGGSCGLLREIHALEKCAQRLAEAIDAAPVPLTGEREAEVREAAAELAVACAAMKDGLDPLERQVREVFHRIVRSRMEGLDSPMLNAD